MNFVEAGAVGQRRGDDSFAETCYLTALAENPHDSKAWQALAVIQASKGYAESAVVMTEKAIQLDCNQSTALAQCNLGNLLWQIEKIPEALEAFHTAEKSGLDNWMLWSNLGLLHLSIGHPQKAIDNFNKAFITLRDEKEIKKLLTHIGYAYLMSGDLEIGFGLVQEEWSKSLHPIHCRGVPEWQVIEYPSKASINIRGATIFVYHNQGAGDTIQFARFLQGLYDLGAEKVILSVPQSLTRLFRKYTVKTVVHQVGDPLPEGVDFATPISALPFHLRISMDNLSLFKLPDPDPFTSPSSSLPRTVLKVGLVWAARQDQTTGPRRSVPLKDLLPLTTIPGVKVFGLQVGETAEDIKKIGAEHLIEDCSPQIRDFLDLSETMETMDVVVSADTAPLHLAGTLGIPSIGMLSYSGADWRWLSSERTASPWYPGMQLVRQKTPRDWSSVVEEVKGRLQGMIAP